MTDAPVGFLEKPPSIKATQHRPKASKKCGCDSACKRLTGDIAYIKQRQDNLEARLELLDNSKKKQEVWTYKCSKPGCPQLVEVGPPETRVGHNMVCPVHGQVVLFLVSPMAG